MSSISFDPIAHAYDQTRGYPPGVDRQIAKGLEKAAETQEQTSFIEVGVGTGRIAIPLASLGHNYTGVDISEKMLALLEAKLQDNQWERYAEPWGARADEILDPPHPVRRYGQMDPTATLRLLISDITALPLMDESFDVAVAVHIFHLVDGWQQAVREALRVLRPGGLLLHCWDRHNDALDIVAQTWMTIVAELGGNASRVGSEKPTMVSDWLREQGLPVEELSVAQWEVTTTPRSALQRISERLWSRAWQVPDEMFQESVRRLEAWVLGHFGADQLDAPYTNRTEFIVHKTRLPLDKQELRFLLS